jgi:predicted transposase/invertase (TIGR01784 family)
MAERKLVSFDWAMKTILRQKANFEILEGFLTELLKFDIKIEEILESEANQETNEDKFNRVDLLAKNQNGELILIEIQHNSEVDYFHRILYGTSKLISEHIKKGKGYSQIKKVYSVNIVYFDFGQGFDYLYHGKIDFKGMNHKDDNLNLSKNQKEKFKLKNVSDIFPEYFIIKVNKFDDLVKNTIDEWIYFLKKEEIKKDFLAKGLDVAKERLDVLKLDTKERAIYKRREENEIYKNSLLETARDEGLEKGAKSKQIEIARTSLKQGLEIKIISLITGLTIQEIEQLK